MGKKGLLIAYDYCTGCHTCEVACKQEHGYPAGRWGIMVKDCTRGVGGPRAGGLSAVSHRPVRSLRQAHRSRGKAGMCQALHGGVHQLRRGQRTRADHGDHAQERVVLAALVALLRVRRERSTDGTAWTSIDQVEPGAG